MGLHRGIAAELLIVVVVCFGAFEISRWRRPDLSDLLSPVQKVRRLFGLFILLVLALMFYAGTFFPPPAYLPLMLIRLEIIYWFLFALLTVFLPLIAFFEFKDTVKRASKLRREVYRSVITAPLDDATNDDEPPQKLQP